MRYVRPALTLALVFATLSIGRAAGSDGDASCRPFYGSACSEAIGHWLPRVPNASFFSSARSTQTRTQVADALVDPAGAGDRRFLAMRGVVGGSLFVYGDAGPPKGHAVYDPAHRIAFYDEGCCSWHRVTLASGVSAPPKAIATRSLLAVHSQRGIRLGDSPAKIVAIFGRAKPRAVFGNVRESTLSYVRDIINPKPDSPCVATMTFLFARDRLRAMDYDSAC